MATHSNILAWESHGQRSLEGYSPWGHKELDKTEHTHTHTHTHSQYVAQIQMLDNTVRKQLL